MTNPIDWKIHRAAEKVVRHIIGHLDKHEREFSMLDSSVWFYTPAVDIYVRAPLRGKQVDNPWDVCLANIQVAAEQTGKGIMTAVLDMLEPRYTVKIESVLDPRFRDYLVEKRGYEIMPETLTFDESIASYIKRNESNAAGRHRVA